MPWVQVVKGNVSLQHFCSSFTLQLGESLSPLIVNVNSDSVTDSGLWREARGVLLDRSQDSFGKPNGCGFPH